MPLIILGLMISMPFAAAQAPLGEKNFPLKKMSSKSLRRISTKKVEGGWSSGGGSAIICYFLNAIMHIPESFVGELPEGALDPKNIESITQYDLYYAQKKQESDNKLAALYRMDDQKPRSLFEIMKPKKEGTLKTFFTRVLNRIGLISPKLKKIILTSHKSFDIIEKSNGINPVDDFTDFLEEERPDRCVVAQMARQRSIGNFHELDLDTKLFFHEKHTLDSQVTVMLHEDVYLYGRKERGHKKADATHVLVAQLLNGHLQIDRLLSAMANFSLDVSDTVFYPRIAKAFQSVEDKIQKIGNKFQEKINNNASQLAKNPIYRLPFNKFKVWEHQYLNPKSKDFNFEYKNFSPTSYFFLLYLSRSLEGTILAPHYHSQRHLVWMEMAKENGNEIMAAQSQKSYDDLKEARKKSLLFLQHYRTIRQQQGPMGFQFITDLENAIAELRETTISFEVLELGLTYENTSSDKITEIWKDYLAQIETDFQQIKTNWHRELANLYDYESVTFLAHDYKNNSLHPKMRELIKKKEQQDKKIKVIKKQLSAFFEGIGEWKRAHDLSGHPYAQIKRLF